MQRLMDVGLSVILKVALWGLMVASFYAIKSIGMWVMLVGAITLGIIEGIFPRIRRWIYR